MVNDLRTRASFELVEGENDQWHWRLRAANGEVLAHSEQYPSRGIAEDGVIAAMAAARNAEVVLVEKADA